MDNNLYEAAILIENNWTKKAFLEAAGEIKNYCLDGALRQITYGTIDDDLSELFDYTNHAPDSEQDRSYVASMKRLISVMPKVAGCCHLQANGPDRVWHYNDLHCDGGVTASKLLREAAEVE